MVLTFLNTSLAEKGTPKFSHRRPSDRRFPHPATDPSLERLGLNVRFSSFASPDGVATEARPARVATRPVRWEPGSTHQSERWQELDRLERSSFQENIRTCKVATQLHYAPIGRSVDLRVLHGVEDATRSVVLTVVPGTLLSPRFGGRAPFLPGRTPSRPQER